MTLQKNEYDTIYIPHIVVVIVCWMEQQNECVGLFKQTSTLFLGAIKLFIRVNDNNTQIHSSTT